MSTRAQELKVMEQRKNGARKRAQKVVVTPKPRRMAAAAKRAPGLVKAVRRPSVRKMKAVAIKA